MTRSLPFLLMCLSVPQIGCGVPPPAAGSPVPDGQRPVDSLVSPTGDSLPQLPTLRLEALHGERPQLPEHLRNPFRFGSPTPAADGLLSAASTARADTVAATDAPFSGPPDTTRTAIRSAREPDPGLRLIGIVEAPRTGGPVAVLADAQGVHHGRLGDAVDGRYRIVAFEEAAVEVEDIARRVRTTLRLAGS